MRDVSSSSVVDSVLYVKVLEIPLVIEVRLVATPKTDESNYPARYYAALVDSKKIFLVWSLGRAVSLA